MSENKTSNKKRRLESETSGITVLSTLTQSTEVSNDDFDENSSDSTSNNIYNGSSSNITNTFSKQLQRSNINGKNVKRPQRKRQVSWCNDVDDETFVKEPSQFDPSGPTFMAPYDNNFSGTNNSRRRTRRATESSLDTHAFMQSPGVFNFSGQINQGTSPHKSLTASQIHGHERDIQRQWLQEQLIREHDAQRLYERQKARSETFLVDPNHSVRNVYEPLNNTKKPENPKKPLETVVTIENSGSNYLHPMTNVNRGTLSIGNSSYADVNVHGETSTTDRTKVFCCRNCNKSFFRKGFFVLLVLNIVLVLFNAVCISLATRNAVQPEVGAQPSQICVECAALTENDRKMFSSSNDVQKCCGSADKMFPALLQVAEESFTQKLRMNFHQEKSGVKVPVVQLKASNKTSDNIDKLKIIWDERPDVNTLSAEIVDKTSVIISKPGYYYIYSRIHYRNTNKRDKSEFTVGHKVMRMKKDDRQAKEIDGIVQKCFPSATTGDVRHTNHIGSVQYLGEGDKVFIKLDHRKHFHHESSIFGMFLVAT